MNSVQKAEQAVKNAREARDTCVELADAYCLEVGRLQTQLDQALKELEKAKKPEVWEGDFANGLQLRDPMVFGSTASFGYPCKVTVRPLGGPGPLVFESEVSRSYMDSWFIPPRNCVGSVECMRIAHLIGKKVRVTVEEIE